MQQALATSSKIHLVVHKQPQPTSA